MNTETRERRRSKFRPARVIVLLVGESPPAGGTFFYEENSILYEQTRRAFEQVIPKKTWGNAASFLDVFRSLGFYLEDLSADPLNEPPRVSWRLQPLRGWSHEQHIEEVSS